MYLSMSLDLQQTLSVTGGITGEDTVFPAVSAWLNESSDRFQALSFVARRKNMDRYRSVTDFLLCEIVPSLRSACFRFYDGRGRPLRSIAQPELLAYLEAKILAFLEICYASHCQARALTWSQAVTVLSELEAA